MGDMDIDATELKGEAERLVDDDVTAYGPQLMPGAKEKILAEPDAFTPPAPNASLISPAVTYAKALHANIQRLKLDVQVIAPFHGNRKSDVAELARLAGVNATN